jgi:hypothetical protein
LLFVGMSRFPAAVVQVIGILKCVGGGKQQPFQKKASEELACRCEAA